MKSSTVLPIIYWFLLLRMQLFRLKKKENIRVNLGNWWMNK